MNSNSAAFEADVVGLDVTGTSYQELVVSFDNFEFRRALQQR